MQRRRALAALAVVPLTLLVPEVAAARCAMLSLPDELRSSSFVFEATVVAAGPPVALRVLAMWKGVLPDHVTVGISGRGNPFAGAGPSDVFLVLTSGPANALHVNRCGSSGRLQAADLETLRQAGLTRRPLTP